MSDIIQKYQPKASYLGYTDTMKASRNAVIILFFLMFILIGFIIERLTLPETTESMLIEAELAANEQINLVPDLPFVYDGCTLFVDSILWSDFSHACYVHDIAYWIGGTSEERKAADQSLAKAVAKTGLIGKLVEYPVYIGVRIFGNSPLTKALNANWGFGWE
ncbi:MAG: hypothetical protein DRI46_13590 [Chloroflexi bacterium]|nr:MAG: hypothetical protein DRI46_13590 [Chloroflexota bacterium]